jgi:hypothetical protein
MTEGNPAPRPSSIAIRLVEELHRRQVRYDHGPPMTEHVCTQVEGELIGLRVALGIALGYPGASGTVVPEARRFYGRWLTEQGVS